jgi:hypothetical protein
VVLVKLSFQPLWASNLSSMPGGDFRMISCGSSPDYEISGFFGLLLEFLIT